MHFCSIVSTYFVNDCSCICSISSSFPMRFPLSLPWYAIPYSNHEELITDFILKHTPFCFTIFACKSAVDFNYPTCQPPICRCACQPPISFPVLDILYLQNP